MRLLYVDGITDRQLTMRGIKAVGRGGNDQAGEDQYTPTSCTEAVTTIANIA